MPRVRLWADRRSVRSGQPLTLRGRVVAVTSVGSSLAIQAWQEDGWRTLDRDRASRSGFFGEQVTVPGDPDARVVLLRVVADATAASRPLSVRVLP